MRKRILTAIILLSLTACATHKPTVGEAEEINQYTDRLCCVLEEKNERS
ncbi:hypothetical protein KA005_67880 [bacterium]|nr:hypothetical protein [bacterium]